MVSTGCLRWVYYIYGVYGVYGLRFYRFFTEVYYRGLLQIMVVARDLFNYIHFYLHGDNIYDINSQRGKFFPSLNGLLRSRWDRATDHQKSYMRAISPRRSELISKGLIYSPQHGTVAFTVPHMAAFINRQKD